MASGRRAKTARTALRPYRRSSGVRSGVDGAAAVATVGVVVGAFFVRHGSGRSPGVSSLRMWLTGKEAAV
jgi:hypothetical protein